MALWIISLGYLGKTLEALIVQPDLVGCVEDGSMEGLLVKGGIGNKGFDLGEVGFLLNFSTLLADVIPVGRAPVRGRGVAGAVGGAGRDAGVLFLGMGGG